MVVVPEVVRRKALAAGADGWLAGIDDLVASLAARWSLTLGPELGGGTEAIVLEVTQADGSPAVLKLLVPQADDVAVHEVAVLRHAGGGGCVRLLDADEAAAALLLERLGPSMHDLGTLPYVERLEVLADLCAEMWRLVSGTSLPSLPSGAQKATWLMDRITRSWETLDRPCPEAVVEHAVACAERRRAAHDDTAAVLVHGDVHQWNALRRGDGWALVDPDGLLAEPEYDLGVLLREDPDELLAAGPFLERMLAVAADWRPGTTPRLADQVLADPALTHYVAGWLRRGDLGVVAEDVGGEPLGAAWARRFAPDDAGYGFVDEDVPEVSVGVIPTARGLGIGRRLLVALADAARGLGTERLSLSVETENPALHLYRSLGWSVVAEAPGSATMVLDLR